MVTSREEKMREVQDEINREERKKIIIKKTIFFIKLFLIIFIVLFSIYFYITRIATHSIIVKEIRISDRDIPRDFDSYKVIYFSDLYFNKDNKDDLNNLVIEINKRKPDLVLFSSKLLKGSISNKDKEYLINSLNSIDTTSGKYALSNDDNEKNILMQSGFTILDNNTTLVYRNTSTPLVLSGLNDVNTFNDLYNGLNNGGYNILLLNNPDDVYNSYYRANLILAGKSLNGEICLTKDKCLYKEDGAKKFFKEHYKVKNKDLYISSGIGTNKYSFRFNARPSIYFFRLASK